jgi:hypothetical protein
MQDVVSQSMVENRQILMGHPVFSFLLQSVGVIAFHMSETHSNFDLIKVIMK